MTIALRKGERICLDGIVWAVDRRVPTGFQLISVGDGTFRILEESELLESFHEGRFESLLPSLDGEAHTALNPLDRDFVAFSESERGEAERRCLYLQKLVEIVGSPPYSNSALHAAIARIALELGDSESIPSPRTLRRWIARDREAKSDVRAQIPRYFGRGNRQSRFSDIVQNIAKKTFDDYVMRPAPAPIKEVYATFVSRISNENNLRPVSRLRVPSLPTFYRWAAKLDDEDRIATQRGPRAAEARYLAVQAAPAETIPMATVEIDHTCVDCIVVDEQGLLLGRPTLTVAIDRATRMCTGFVLTWEPPSYQCVMLVMRHMIRDKSYVKGAFGDNIHFEWPCFGLPRTIVIDNGMEFHSTHLKAACLQLGRISIEYAPTKSPRHKGKVERFFRTLNDQLFHLLPGTTLSGVDRNSDYNPSNAATVTLRHLNQLLHKFIIDIYSRTFHRGLRDVPIEAWSRGVKMHPLRLPPSVKDLDILSCGRAQRTIGRQGIELFSLFYQSSELGALRVQRKGSVKVEVRYDPTDIGMIWVAEPCSGRHIPVPCRSRSYAPGLTIWQHNRILEHLGQRRHSATEGDLLKARSELRQMIDRTEECATARKRPWKRHARFIERPATPDRLAQQAGSAERTGMNEQRGASECDLPQQPRPASGPAEGRDPSGDLDEFIRTHGFEARER
jgi:putative transposase